MPWQERQPVGRTAADELVPENMFIDDMAEPRVGGGRGAMVSGVEILRLTRGGSLVALDHHYRVGRTATAVGSHDGQRDVAGKRTVIRFDLHGGGHEIKSDRSRRKVRGRECRGAPRQWRGDPVLGAEVLVIILDGRAFDRA